MPEKMTDSPATRHMKSSPEWLQGRVAVLEAANTELQRANVAWKLAGKNQAELTQTYRVRNIELKAALTRLGDADEFFFPPNGKQSLVDRYRDELYAHIEYANKAVQDD